MNKDPRVNRDFFIAKLIFKAISGRIGIEIT